MSSSPRDRRLAATLSPWFVLALLLAVIGWGGRELARAAPVAKGASAAIAVGDHAPGFTLTASNGTAVSLATLLAKGGGGPLLIAFFPKAFTGG